MLEQVGGPPAALPDYLEKTYWWAYLRPASIRIFDHAPVVSMILWGQYRRLEELVLARVAPGARVLQLACVYGDLSPRLARQIGPSGALDIVDIAPIQVSNVQKKLAGVQQVTTRIGDASVRQAARYDRVISFFLLHELPDQMKYRAVDAALAAVDSGGQAVFVDYARPARWHPLRPVMAAVFALLEPYAATMWRHPVAAFASRPQDFQWHRSTCFGGLYQVVVATRHGP